MRLDSLADLLRACTIAPRPRARGQATRPLRVVHLVPSLGWGGAERLACTMHRLCQQGGLDSHLEAPSLPALAHGIADETGEAPIHHEGEHTLRAWALGARARLQSLRPDVVHAHLPYPDRFAAALIAAHGRPLVTTFQLLPQAGRSWSLDELLGWRSDRALALLGRLPRRARFVAVSTDDHARLGALLPARRLVRLANAPPLARVRLPELPPVPWPQDCVRLLSVGRLHPQKGFDRLVPVLAHPRLRALRWHWVIGGRGDEQDALTRALAAAGLTERVTFAPEYPASMLYPSAELVLSPSRWEGMPLVPMEAVEAGVPVLGSEIDPHRELFARAPASLLPADEDGWTEPLATLLADAPARQALARVQRQALATDPRKQMWEAYLALYRAVCIE